MLLLLGFVTALPQIDVTLKDNEIEKISENQDNNRSIDDTTIISDLQVNETSTTSNINEENSEEEDIETTTNLEMDEFNNSTDTSISISNTTISKDDELIKEASTLPIFSSNVKFF